MKKIFSITSLLLLVLFACTNVTQQDKNIPSEKGNEQPEIVSPENQKLYNLLKEKDSLLFQIGFNQIDTAQIAALACTDFEFYHDEHGITETKSDFVKSIGGLKDLPFKTWRTLVKGSMEVFPLYKDNKQVLSGAIQNGTHDFYQQIEGEKARKTNTARFTHLWIIEDGNWKLKRVLSFDHHVPK
jgi:hypothetical protein